MANAIKTLFNNLSIKNKNVATAISGFSVIVKKIKIAQREEVELETSIHEEAEQYIPFDISDVNLDYEVLSDLEEEGEESDSDAKKESESMDILLVAAKKDIIEDYESVIHLAGLNPVVMDVDAFALQNAFEISSDDTDGCYALINIGSEELGINAVKDGVSMFTRDSSYGGAQISEGIMSKLDISFEEAERMKLGGVKIEKEKQILTEVFSSIITDWVQEIRRALDFLDSTYPEETIEKIYISGGAFRIPGLKKFLELETNIPIEELNPFANLMINEKMFDPRYLSYMACQAGVAVGLALRSIGDK